ncbi:glucose-1-phosphate adenylyltransferase [Planctopirus limnophila DSM 3776]|uniref:Glucose-1-phosphate adenylyltransferase n=1 Tax=Planctopirus limnophila (strain ATCC 43296 / DSM 3776 / IFAM 1008 / Mu 290) TaxID=521674 RepID=D5SXW7_PLAL2|nr:glucose-1-phosphate adenylyltransferase [Planctopirus limnophila]ADG67804.1 glucose-1-phosphate adenylyltransferase [Planctopirus limnophila DSM 3776]
MRNVVSVILGGGKGTRLYPLTKDRSKPAVPLGGKYRLIDIPISNCLNSGLNRIYLLTQFNSVSLHKHIRQTYRFDRFDGGFVEIMAAQQTMEGEAWYQGTADAVRKNMRHLEQKGIDYVLILSGDQLYRMDFQEMIATHQAAKADVTIAGLPVTREAARGFGVMRLDDTGKVLGFLEKPQTDEEIDLVKMDPKWIDAQGIESKGRDCLASMGIYLFNRDVLVDLLSRSDYHDFGKEIFPMSIRTHKVQVHLFDGYWEDIGTIRSFYDANLDLAKSSPPFSLADAKRPIFTHARFLPPVRLEGATATQTLIADGVSVGTGTVLENCVIGLRCRIGKKSTIRNTIIMGADSYETEAELAANRKLGIPPMGIGDGCVIDGAIIDKDCRIGNNVKITNCQTGTLPKDSPLVLQDGVLVVPKGTTLPDGWSLEALGASR